MLIALEDYFENPTKTHPSINFLYHLTKSGTYPSCDRAKGDAHPGPIASILQVYTFFGVTVRTG